MILHFLSLAPASNWYHFTASSLSVTLSCRCLFQSWCLTSGSSRPFFSSTPEVLQWCGQRTRFQFILILFTIKYVYLRCSSMSYYNEWILFSCFLSFFSRSSSCSTQLRLLNINAGDREGTSLVAHQIWARNYIIALIFTTALENG